MPFNGSGVFQRVRNWVADATAGIKIRADYHDAEDDGFAAGLSNCITKDGQTIVTQNIPMNSKRITGLADPINPQDASTKAYADTKMSGTGGKLTGDLEIEKASPVIILDDTTPVGEISGGAQIQGQRVSKMRWLLRVGNGEAETGTNAGSNFDISRFADDGGHIAAALHISRATGLMTVTDADPVAANGVATKSYVDTKDAALQTSIDAKQAALGFIPVQQSGGAGMLTNKVYIGWSGSQLLAQVDGVPQGAFFFGTPTGTVSSGRLALAGNASWTGAQTVSEPFAGAVCTGLSAAAGGGMTGRFRYLQLLTTGWFTVAYT